MIKSKLLFVILNILLVVFLILTGAIPIVYKVFYYLIFLYLIANVLVNKSPFSKIISYIIVFGPLIVLYGSGYLYAILNNEDEFLGKPYFWGILLVCFLILFKNIFKFKNIYVFLLTMTFSAFITFTDYYLFNSDASIDIDKQKSKEVVFFDSIHNTINFDSLKGKLTLIEFWTTSCASCPESLKSFEELASQYKANNNVVFLTVNINLGKRQDTIYKKELESKILLPKLNTENKIFQQLNFNAAPAVLVLNNNAEIVYFGVPNFRKYSRNYLPDIINNELNKM